MTPLEFLQSIPHVDGLGTPGNVENPFLFDATESELDAFIMVCMVVAGKNARIQQDKLWLFMSNLGYDPGTPGLLNHLHEMSGEELERELRNVRMGQYRRLVRGLKYFADLRVNGGLNLRTCLREDLTAIPGIGLKTASFFLLYTRLGIADMACLDTHILKFMRDSGLDASAPSNTPVPDRYLELERKFVDLCAEAGRTVPSVDFDIWSFYSTKQNGSVPHSSQPG